MIHCGHRTAFPQSCLLQDGVQLSYFLSAYRPFEEDEKCNSISLGDAKLGLLTIIEHFINLPVCEMSSGAHLCHWFCTKSGYPMAGSSWLLNQVLY